MSSIHRSLSKTTILTIVMSAMTFVSASAYRYSYSFNNTPISEALVRISKDHPDVNISFIYKELDNYRTSAKVRTDDIYDALRQAIGLNPVSIIRNGDHYYAEAFQHGRFSYNGRAVGRGEEPLAGATVMLLAPKDSAVVTYGITDSEGRFSIPCDRREVIAKLSCLGYRTIFRKCQSFNVGTICMTELPVRLHGVKIEADNASLLSDKSVYRPTQRQKNASQTATDLLVRMAIPQLNATMGSSGITTASGESVAIYIDYVPASQNDLKMMRVSDVKTVEYLVYPADPRFQGNRNVINFRMIKYEYGGYVKVLGSENFIANSGSLQGNARMVKKKMTFDIMGYGYYMSNDHFGVAQTESFRLSRENGAVRSFLRESLTETSKYRRKNYETSLRALYSGEKVTANSQISFGLDDTPHNDNNGTVKYTDNLLGQSDYTTVATSKARYVSYNGYYFFLLPKNSSLTSSISYSYSTTDQESQYSETNIAPIDNIARDRTHRGNIGLNFSHFFSDKQSLMAHVTGLYEHNMTDYLGSANAHDNSTTKFGQIGASYNFTGAKVSAFLGIGWNWLTTGLNKNKATSDYPYVDASLRFVPNKKNSFGIIFHYSVWPPSSNYKSENIIHVSPYLWLTGNPLLKSHRSYDIGISHTFIPSNKFNMTLFVNSWLVGNRAAFVYVATPDGILRTIQQPVGRFGHYNYGINAASNWLDGKLYLSGQLAQLFVHNGLPYNIDHSHISFYLQALYYLGNFNFAITYNSDNATDNYNSMSGIWTKNKDAFVLQAGWSNSSWNIRLTARNIQRWNWRSSHETMKSDNYSVDRWISNASGHAFVQISATYTFGFGKKIKHDNEPQASGSASSGILK